LFSAKVHVFFRKLPNFERFENSRAKIPFQTRAREIMPQLAILKQFKDFYGQTYFISYSFKKTQFSNVLRKFMQNYHFKRFPETICYIWRFSEV